METTDQRPDKGALEQLILAMIEKQGPGKTLYPSEVGHRALPELWRLLMDDVHRLVRDMRANGAQSSKFSKSPDHNIAGLTRRAWEHHRMQRNCAIFVPAIGA